MAILWNVVLEELEKMGAVSADEARRAIDRLDTLEKNKLTPEQVGRYALLGGVSAPVISAIGDAIQGNAPLGISAGTSKAQAIRNIAASAAKGAIGTGLIPLVRASLDRGAEKAKLREFISDLHMPSPSEYPASPKIAFATSEYSGPTGGGGFNLVSGLPNKPAPSLAAPVVKAAAIGAAESFKVAAVMRLPGGATPAQRLRSATSIGAEAGRDLTPDGPSIAQAYKTLKGKGSGGEIFGAKKASAIKEAYTPEQFRQLSRGAAADYLATGGATMWDWAHAADPLKNKFPGAVKPFEMLSPAEKNQLRLIQGERIQQTVSAPGKVDLHAPKGAPAVPQLSPEEAFAKEVASAREAEQYREGYAKMKNEVANAGIPASKPTPKPADFATTVDPAGPTMGAAPKPSSVATVANAPSPISASTPAPLESGIRVKAPAKSPLEVLGKTPQTPQQPIGKVLPAKPIVLDMGEIGSNLTRPSVPRPRLVPKPSSIPAGLAKAVGHLLGDTIMIREALAKIAALETNQGTVETGRKGEPEDYTWTQDIDPEPAGTTNSGRKPGMETGHSGTEESVGQETVGKLRELFTNYQNAANADKERISDLFDAGKSGYYVTRNPTLMDQVRRVVGRKLGAKNTGGVLLHQYLRSSRESSYHAGTSIRLGLHAYAALAHVRLLLLVLPTRSSHTVLGSKRSLF